MHEGKLSLSWKFGGPETELQQVRLIDPKPVTCSERACTAAATSAKTQQGLLLKNDGKDNAA